MWNTRKNNKTYSHDILSREKVWYQIIDKEGQVVYMNKFAQELCGYSLDEMISNNLFWITFFRTKETGLRYLTLYKNFIKRQKEVISNIAEITTKSGEKISICWTLKCNFNDSGKANGATIFGIKLSQAEELLFRNQNSKNDRYRQIFKNAPIGFFRTLPEGKFIEVNNALAKMLGYNTPDNVLTDITQIGNDIYQNPEIRKKIVNETLSSGGVNSYETIFIDRNKKPVDVRINVSSRYDKGIDNHILEGTIENITDRKVAEKKLHENLLKYSTLFEKSPISIWEIDFSAMKAELDRLPLEAESMQKYFVQNPDQLTKIRKSVKVIDVNQASLKLFETENKASLLAMQQSLVNAPLSEAEQKTMQCFINNVSTFEHETTIRTTKSGNKNIIVRWVVAPDTDKPYSRVLVTMIDITQHRTEQEALRKSKNELSTLLSSMDDLVFIINREGKYLYVARTRPDLLITSANKLEGNYLRDYLDHEIESKFIKIIEASIQKKETLSIDYPLRIKGREYWFEAKISPLNDESVIAVARDITQRINTHKVNEVMLNVAGAVATTDELNELFDLIRTELSKIIDTRNFFLALFNAETNTLELPYFKDEKDSFDHFPAEKTLSSIVIREKKTLFLQESEIMNLADTGKINVVGSVAKVWLGIPLMVEGKVLGVMVVQNYEDENAIRDYHKQLLEVISPQISLSIKRKQSDQLLRESEKQLRESNATKDQFFNIIAHDLKNPFNAIIGFSSLLTDEWNDFDDDDKIAMISSIRSSSEGAFELLMNLLDWSRLQVGKLRFEPEFIDFRSLIKLNLSLLKTATEKKNIKLVSIGICDKMIWADPNMIKTVIRNLITNAIKFTPVNGTVTLECKKSQDHPGMMLLLIKDNGVGIPKQQLQDIFKLNNSKSNRGTDGETGTGLGLVLCKEFVEKNRGKIWVESKPYVGSTFFVALPVRPN